MEAFGCRTGVICGEGALKTAADGSWNRMAVVTDGFQSRDGPLRAFLESQKGKQLLVLEDGVPEPTAAQAVAGANKLKVFAPDRVLALGDTGVLDWAKAMVCFSGLGCPLTVVPTAMGPGTEITDRVVLTHDRRRHLLRDEAMRPDKAIWDDAILGMQPKSAVREGGFCLLANALEACTGRQRGLLTQVHGREAFCTAWAALPASLTGNAGARHRVRTASVLTGLAVDRAGLGLCGAMGNSLGAIFHLSPGKLAAILLPAVIGCNSHAAGKTYAALARAAGMGGGSEAMGVRNLKSGLLRLRRELGLPETLARAGVEPRQVWGQAGRIVELTLEDPDCRNNPLTVDDFLVRRILEEITGSF